MKNRIRVPVFHVAESSGGEEVEFRLLKEDSETDGVFITLSKESASYVLKYIRDEERFIYPQVYDLLLKFMDIGGFSIESIEFHHFNKTVLYGALNISKNGSLTTLNAMVTVALVLVVATGLGDDVFMVELDESEYEDHVRRRVTIGFSGIASCEEILEDANNGLFKYKYKN